jgi:hypothetical protein
MRAARKPSGVARELLRNFPKSGSRRRRRKRKGASRDGRGPDRANGAEAKAGAEDGTEGVESENGADTAASEDGAGQAGASEEPAEATEES